MSTRVVHGAGAGEAARRMMPTLPGSCFAEAGPDGLGAAVEQAVADGIERFVLVTGLGEQAAFLGGGSGLAGVLDSITLDMDGGAALAAEVADAPTPRHAYELWESAGRLGPCGRELCRRTAGELERLAAAAAGTSASPVAAQVVLVDAEGERMVGMYGRMSRSPARSDVGGTTPHTPRNSSVGGGADHADGRRP
ncbi:hypothetical protein ACFOY4_05855 [Actinomadura syzygii]|uniref:Cobalt-precorrin-5B (C(1))-methyltransferase n=1 Tax=Actinomadura syzygii TaxID=1427538 RepID=A0A5D0TVT8_9ACTN|nr:hypothetical protein [Actinomadura syzygii]TYC10381.1 hypothetical protein FXF65_31235 [Actinomadura syzygii]